MPNAASCSQLSLACPLWHPTRCRIAYWSLAQLLRQVTVTFAGQIKIRLASLLGGLLETVQDIDRIGKPRDVDNTERPSRVPNPNLLNAGADTGKARRSSSELPRNSTGLRPAVS